MDAAYKKYTIAQSVKLNFIEKCSNMKVKHPKAYEEISDWHSAQLFRYKLNHYLYMSGWTAVFTVWRICGRITCYAAVLYHDDDRSLDFAVPRGRGVPEYGQISYIHIAPGALN